MTRDQLGRDGVDEEFQLTKVKLGRDGGKTVMLYGRVVVVVSSEMKNWNWLGLYLSRRGWNVRYTYMIWCAEPVKK